VKKLHTERRCVTVAVNRLWRSENHRGRRTAVWSRGEYLVIHRAEAAPASQYGFASDFCHANDPQSKGIVENLRSAARAGCAALIQAAIDGAASICGSRTLRPRRGAAEVNAAVHSQICAVPDEQLITEREVLQPLPSLRPQIGVPSVLRKVDRLSCVRYASARYSVPTG